jgi:hypothetical protein
MEGKSDAVDRKTVRRGNGDTDRAAGSETALDGAGTASESAARGEQQMAALAGSDAERREPTLENGRVGEDRDSNGWLTTKVWEPVRDYGPVGVTALIAGVLAFLLFAISGVVWVVTAIGPQPTSTRAGWAAVVLFGITVLALLTFFYKLAQAIVTAGVQRALVRRNEAEGKNDIAERISANREALLVWERIVQSQARSAYTYSMLAVVLGLLVLLAGGLVVVSTDDISSQVAVAGLSGVGGAIAGYIARTFLEIHKLAQQQLNFYFVEPLVATTCWPRSG